MESQDKTMEETESKSSDFSESSQTGPSESSDPSGTSGGAGNDELLEALGLGDDYRHYLHTLMLELDGGFEEQLPEETILTDPPDLFHSYGIINDVVDCEICLSKDSKIRNRSCCQIAVCDDCMERYFVAQLESGIKRMQCIATNCSKFVHVDEIMCRLPVDLKEKFYKYLVDANNDPYVKTCPRCSYVQRVTKEELQVPKKKRKYGCHIVCKDCSLEWCFICHAPWHPEGITCKEYRKGDRLVKNWAREFHYGKKNAERCPKCKVYIERTSGCDHMTCRNCDTRFCYKCGERYIDIKFIGNHYERFSPFGCKYKLHPNKPALRKFIRGSVFGAKLVGGLLLGVLAVGGAAVLVAVSPIVIPAYFGEKWRTRRRARRRLKRIQDRNIGQELFSLEDMFVTMRAHGNQNISTQTNEEDGNVTSLSEHEEEEADEESDDNEEGINENVKAIIHKQDDGDMNSPTVVEIKEENLVYVTGRNTDSHVTTADLEMQSSGQVVLHVKTTCKSTEEEKNPEQADNGEFTVTENEDSITDRGCFIKILKKLPSVWEKDKDGEKSQKSESTDDTKSIKEIHASVDHYEGDLSNGSLKFSDTLECLKQLQDESELKDPHYGMVSTTDEITYL